MERTVIIEQVNFKQLKYYLLTFSFVTGNILLPLFCHRFEMAGTVFLPVYFFILTGSYKFGWKVGVITALLSPLANYALTGMPPVAILPEIIVKGVVLALTAAFVASRTHSRLFISLLLITIISQLSGSLLMLLISGNLIHSFSDILIGYPGLLIQIFITYFILSNT